MSLIRDEMKTLVGAESEIRNRCYKLKLHISNCIVLKLIPRDSGI